MRNAQELHYEFVKLGSQRHALKNRLLYILPDIYESGVWKKYAGSIVEYAGKFGDIARTTVLKRLRLEENLENKPFLRAAIEKVGVHKVAMVAKIATPETDKALAEDVLNMSKMAVQSLSKELRTGAVAITKKIELDEETTFLFMKLKAKMGKHMSDKEFLKMMLEKLDKDEFHQKNGRVVENEVPKSVTGETFPKKPNAPTGRYIPVAQKRPAVAQTKGKCGYPNCNAPYQVIHHPHRFSLSHSHDSIIPLCKTHHEFAHNNLIQNETQKPREWGISVIQSPNKKNWPADLLYRKYRQPLTYLE